MAKKNKNQIPLHIAAIADEQEKGVLLLAPFRTDALFYPVIKKNEDLIEKRKC